MSEGTVVDIYEPVISDLKSRIATLQAMLDNLESLRSGAPLHTAGSTTPVRASGTAVNFDHDAFFGMTVADAAKKYLSATKKTASANAIGDALVAGGWKTSAKNIPETVRSILGRQPEFVRINSEFGLAEWYPGRKNAGRRASGAPSAATEESKESSDDSSTEQQQPA